MPRLIVLLRGINVGGSGRLKMADLRAWLNELGYADVETVLQSGNAVVRTSEKPGAVAKDVSGIIEAKAGFRPDTIVRTAAEMKQILAFRHFPQDADPAKSIVHLFDATPDPQGVKRVLAYQGPERAAFHEHEMYVWFPEGQGRSKFAQLPIGRWLKTTGTARNLNTLRALLKLAED